jgi:hypothetical protein
MEMEALQEPRYVRRRPMSGACPHARTRQDRIAGIERSVCLDCGHVSFDFRETAIDVARLDRRRFARRQEAETGLGVDQP